MGLYFASFDAAWKQTAEEVVNARVCECCQTTAAVTDEGPVVAFRDRSPREVRDINVTRLEQGTWTPARPLHVDGWQIDACPVNGPALSARGRDVAAAWFAATEDEGHAFAAFSADAGRTWGDPIRLDDAVVARTRRHRAAGRRLGGGELGRVREQALAAAHAARDVVRRTVGGASSSRGPATDTWPGYPRLARQGDELMLAWTESDRMDAMRDSAEQVKARGRETLPVQRRGDVGRPVQTRPVQTGPASFAERRSDVARLSRRLRRACGPSRTRPSDGAG